MTTMRVNRVCSESVIFPLFFISFGFFVVGPLISDVLPARTVKPRGVIVEEENLGVAQTGWNFVMEEDKGKMQDQDVLMKLTTSPPQMTNEQKVYARQLQKRNKALLEGNITGQRPPSDVIHNRVLRILSWTTDNHTQWPLGTSIFDQCDLPNGHSCENYVDRGRLRDADVVFFHAQAINPVDLPQERSSRQKWLFYEFEMPPQTWIQRESLDPIRNVFNLTSTITFDSDIPILERHSQCYISKERLTRSTKLKTNFAEGKGHRVAWFVSHCDTQSKREEYARALSKYIPVDIVGKCGNITCGNKYKRGDCDETIINPNYKFYLSFESSLCKDYVTEKLWRLMMKPITAIPIVLGSVDYHKMLPEGTYLDIKDYSSPKMLADHLKLLDYDDASFNAYIAKKNSVYCLYPGKKTYQQSRYHCQLCQYLHDNHGNVSTVNDVVDFWSTRRRCTDPREYYSGAFELKN